MSCPPPLTWHLVQLPSPSSLAWGVARSPGEKVSARAHLLVAVVVLALVSAGVGTAYAVRRGTEVSRLSTNIYAALGNQQKTSDQLLIELGPQTEVLFNAAFAQLKSQKKIESEIEHVSVHGNQPNAVRLWRALATP